MKIRYLSSAAFTAAATLSMAATGHAQAPAARPVNPAPPAAAVSATAPAGVGLPSFADLIEHVAPAVVSIDVEGTAKGGLGGKERNDPSEQFRRYFGLPEQDPSTPVRGAGSGFFISADGYIVTNNHVVEGADKITIKTSDDRTLTARLIGRDPATDLAVVKVDGASFPFVSFQDRGRPRVGDWVVAVGNPFNLGGSATVGIVSALSRPNVSGSSYVDYMQIDAAINRGNSGGPTFDVNGRVVGVNSAIFSPSGGSVGIGFDIPADVAAKVSHELIASGKVTRGYIGATVQNVSPDIAASLGDPNAKGAIVAEVVPGGPSAQAGLQPGDLVTAVNGEKIDSNSDLTRRVGLAHPGDNIVLDIRRDGKDRRITLRSGVRPSEESLAARNGGAGAPEDGAEDNSPTGALGLAVSPHQGGGVEVQKVEPKSDAGEKGLKPGDVIERAGERPVNSGADLSAAVAAARTAGRKSVLLQVTRDGRRTFVPIAIEPAKG